jgi:hypothetical protein
LIGDGSRHIPKDAIGADGLILASSISAAVNSVHIWSLQYATSGATALYISQ